MSEATFAIVYQSLSEYFFLLDAMDDTAALLDKFTADARWECYDAGSSTPLLAFSSNDDMRKVIELARLDAGATSLKHHIGGIVVEEASDGLIRARVKVTVTAQPKHANDPVLRNTATCRGEWRRDRGAWKMSAWIIQRDSRSLPAAPAATGLGVSDKLVVERYFREIVDGRGDNLTDFFCEDCVVHRAELTAPIRGIHELRAFFQQARGAIAETRTQIEDVIVSQDRVAARVRHFATFSAPLPTPLGVRDVSGKSVEWTAMAWFEMSGGRIRREWVQRDEVGIYRQLGLLDEIRQAVMGQIEGRSAAR
jgi:predicted ester cyclase